MGFHAGARIEAQMIFLGVFQGLFLYTGSVGNSLLYTLLPSLLPLSHCPMLLFGLPRITCPISHLRVDLWGPL